MAEDAGPEPEPQSETPEERDPAEVDRQLASFESRIQAGEFDRGGFHLAVQQELFPLLGDGSVEPDRFNRLVTLWAMRSHPFDWTLKPFGRPN